MLSPSEITHYIWKRRTEKHDAGIHLLSVIEGDDLEAGDLVVQGISIYEENEVILFLEACNLYAYATLGAIYSDPNSVLRGLHFRGMERSGVWTYFFAEPLRFLRRGAGYREDSDLIDWCI